MLKSKSPVLVEHMIHSSVTREGGEALGLLLKRPWSIVTGMEAVDRQVRAAKGGCGCMMVVCTLEPSRVCSEINSHYGKAVTVYYVLHVSFHWSVTV